MDIRKYILDNLKQINIQNEDLTAETNFILKYMFNINNPYIDTDYDNVDINKLNKVFAERETGKPLQYILNTAEFMGEKFFVDENVLIPRPETEILVRKVMEFAKNFNNPKILDIGTGSGCIPIMLKKHISNAKISSCDVSEKAINVAKKNAIELKTNIHFIHSDLFQNITEKFDIIVSNPPYIPPQEKTNIQKEVRFEPDLALYTNDKMGIEFYEKIIKSSSEFLNDNGYLCFELGIKQSELVKNLFIKYNFDNIEIIKDLDNIDRVICARIKK
ncbi:MAG: peptide chain release factor N(5)-glutamine methyltransferase [Candidatus Gastranaerophilales bacterium]|nr:peptide chain release factor N(5)-glutamine methyltransferase [Candidatus Gastranaerophilales bacterium]